MSDTRTLTPSACPGHLEWSAFGATYMDTVCSNSLNWEAGEDPGAELCDADNGFRPSGTPCPLCDSEGFQEWLGWRDGLTKLLWSKDEQPVAEETPITFHDGKALTWTAIHPERGEETVLAREDDSDD